MCALERVVLLRHGAPGRHFLKGCDEKLVEKVKSQGRRRYEGIARLTPVNFEDQGTRQGADEACSGMARSGMRIHGIYQ
jgi:hypothetical protein